MAESSDAMAETERQVSEAEDEWMRELHERRDEEMRLSKALHQQHKKQRATLSRRAENAKKFAKDMEDERRRLEGQKRSQLRRRRNMLNTLAATLVLANLTAFVLAMLVYAYVSLVAAVVVFFPAAFAITGISCSRYFRGLSLKKDRPTDWSLAAFKDQCVLSARGDPAAFLPWLTG
mmetsp:Transcript_3551/g.13989  ORF Transcript_3551/g.13989 Transcript_3551/m.13989 type:complete len:177 (-) Transcript_3551:280-810(-)